MKYRSHTRHLFAAMAAWVAASWSCTATGPVDTEPPSMRVDTPERAARLDGASLVVRGRAIDRESGVAAVEVAGIAATLTTAGEFAAELDLEPGLQFIEIAARDRAGNSTRDLRAVLVGAISDAGAPITDALFARVGPSSYPMLAAAVGRLLSNADLAAGASVGYQVLGGCFGMEVALERLSHSGIEVTMEPRAGAIAVSIHITEPVADARVDSYELCQASSSTARMEADALHLSGLVRVHLSANGPDVEVDGLSVELDRPRIDSDALASDRLGLLGDSAPAIMAEALTAAIRHAAGKALIELLSQVEGLDWQTSVDALDLDVRVVPTALAAAADGLSVSCSVEAAYGDGSAVDHVRLGRQPGLPTGPIPGAQLGLSDDLVNLALAALWQRGFLDHSMTFAADHPARTLLGLDGLTVALQLPPMVRTGDGVAEIAVGDALVTALDERGSAVMVIGASAKAELIIGPDQDQPITVRADQGEVWLSPVSDPAIDSSQLDLPEPLRAEALNQMGAVIGQAIAALPQPGIAGIRIASPTVDAAPGYLVVNAELVEL